MLGSGRSLFPAVAAYPQRSSSLLSPTASTVSVSSSVSTSQPSSDAQELSSRVSLDHTDENNAVGAAAGSRLVCPICNEDMVRYI